MILNVSGDFFLFFFGKSSYTSLKRLPVLNRRKISTSPRTWNRSSVNYGSFVLLSELSCQATHNATQLRRSLIINYKNLHCSVHWLPVHYLLVTFTAVAFNAFAHLLLWNLPVWYRPSKRVWSFPFIPRITRRDNIIMQKSLKKLFR